jgi:hypothetical protein
MNMSGDIITKALQNICAIAGRRVSADELPNDFLIRYANSTCMIEKCGGESARNAHWTPEINNPTSDTAALNPYLDCELRTYIDIKTGLWPGRRQFALCLSHDVDVVARIPTLSSCISRAVLLARRYQFPWRILASSVKQDLLAMIRRSPTAGMTWDYGRWIALERSYGMTSSWLIANHSRSDLKWDCAFGLDDVTLFDGRRLTVKQMLCKLVELGFEVGVHGSFGTQNSAELLLSETKGIELSIGCPVYTNRQHYLRYDCKETPSVHQAVGIATDSSIGFNTGIGFRSGTSFPHFVWDSASSEYTNVLEIPLVVMDTALIDAAGCFDRANGLNRVLDLMHATRRVGGCLTLNWHPNYLDRPEMWSVYCEVLRAAREMGAWGCSLRQVATEWRARLAMFD